MPTDQDYRIRDDDVRKLILWKRLAIARGKILVAYRTTSNPAKAIDDARAAREQLEALGEVGA